jgi:hypothetical protein
MAGTGTTLDTDTGPFSSAMAGNFIYISGGTNFVAGFYWIASVVSSTRVTLDRNATNGSGASSGAGKVGGAQSDLSLVASSVVAGNTVWLKAGTHSVTSSLTFPDSVATAFLPITYEGYTTTHGDATVPVASIDGGNGTFDLVYVGNGSTSTYGYYNFHYIDFTNVSHASGYEACYTRCRENTFYRCRFGDCGGHAFYCPTYWNNLIGCEAYDWAGASTSYGFYSYAWTRIINCYAHDPASTAYGFAVSTAGELWNCIADGCYMGCRVYSTSTYNICPIVDCIFYGCTYGLYTSADNAGVYMRNCIAHSCSTGYSLQGEKWFLNGLAAYNCTTDISTTSAQEVHYLAPSSVISLSYDPFVNASGGDFRLNQRDSAILNDGEGKNYIMDGSETSWSMNRDYGPTQRRHRRVLIGSS